MHTKNEKDTKERGETLNGGLVSCDCELCSSPVKRYLATLREISICTVKNWEFWSSSARVNATSYFDHKRAFGRDNGNTRLAKAGFLASMKKRREQYYYNFSKVDHKYS